jgi:hypothetical protein
MYRRYFFSVILIYSLYFITGSISSASASSSDIANEKQSKIYVPYEELESVFETEQQGVFLPYKEFQRLWQAATGKPAEVSREPFEYLISSARINGRVGNEIATFKLELTVDIISSDWVQVPLGLSEVAVSGASLEDSDQRKSVPLLRVVDGQYIFTVKGKGRYVLMLDFVRQLETQPGLAVLQYKIPQAAITTIDLLIPEENLKVDVEPMLAATTSGIVVDNAGATRLQAFLGSAGSVRLSWKPTTQAAEDIEPVIICDQLVHINVDESIISSEVMLNYNIHRGTVNSFSIQLPREFRITDVNGANIAKWDIQSTQSNGSSPNGQLLKISLFSPVKDQYVLKIKMEQFLQQTSIRVQLQPILTDGAFRQSGLIGITYSSRKLVHLEQLSNLARVDTGQLSASMQRQTGVMAYRFITTYYKGTMVIETTQPRISVVQNLLLGVESDRLELKGKISYKVERAGVFELNMNLPQMWEIESLGPDNIVDDYQVEGQGQYCRLNILLKSEKTGDFVLDIAARSDRQQPDSIVDFSLPKPDSNNLHLYEGQLILALAEQLQAQVEETRQIQALSLRQAQQWTSIAGQTPVMAFEFRTPEPNSPAGGRFAISVKPAQISATVHRLVNIQTGSIQHEAVVQYTIRYAPVDTFYLIMPAEFADAGVEISGGNIKEKPRINELPADQRSDANSVNTDRTTWAYYKVVLQSKVSNSYQLVVQANRTFRAGQTGQRTMVDVPPILAAGILSDQKGYIAVAKADTLAVAEPVIQNLTPADAGSAIDVPYTSHQRLASLAFKYTSPEYVLTLPVLVQEEAAIFTTIVNTAIIEQVLARDGMLNTHATFLLATSQGNRLPVTLPAGAELSAVMLDGDEIPVETGTSADERIVRLPPSAGQVSKFMLEISYGLKGASASALAAPLLPEEIPVQQTLWRLWIPEGYLFLGHDREFSNITENQAYNTLNSLQNQQGRQVGFKLPGQGQAFNFARQGRTATLSVITSGKEFFSIFIWLLIIVVGVLMLKLDGFTRVVIILAAGLLCGIIQLFQPIMLRQICQTGMFAAILVLLLWLTRWWVRKLPQLRLAAAANRQAAKLLKQQQLNAKTDKKSSADNKQNKQPKQEQE